MPKYTQQPGQSANPPPLSPAFAAFAASTEAKKVKKAKQLADFNESGAAHAQALGLVHQVCHLVPDHSARPVVTGKQARANASQRAEKRRQALAAGALDNKEIKASDSEHPLERIKSNRQLNLKTAQILYERAYERNDSLHKTAHKLRVCSTAGAFRMLSQDVCHKTGQALCRSRICPTCQKALSHKRRAAFLGFYDVNAKEMGNYRFYHMVLTLKHSRDLDIRDGLYTKYLLESFKQLRGTSFDGGLDVAARDYWNKRVAGGLYSIETTPGKDGSPHIHMHVLLLAKMPLWRNGQKSLFHKAITARWLQITGDSSQVHLEPVYTWKVDEFGRNVLNKKGEKVKDYVTKQVAALPGLAVDYSAHLRAGVAECAKYALKTDEASLSQFSDSFLYELIETRNRYYGRFGCLHSRDKRSARFVGLNRLNSDFKDLERVEQDAARQMFNPETGEIHMKSQTAMVITNFRNVKAQSAAGRVDGKTLRNGQMAGFEHYYSILDMSKAVEYAADADAGVAKALSVTLYRRYKPEEDIAVEVPPVAEADPAQNSINPVEINPLSTKICRRFLPLPLSSFQYCWLVPIPQLAASIERFVTLSAVIPYRPVCWRLTGR